MKWHTGRRLRITNILDTVSDVVVVILLILGLLIYMCKLCVTILLQYSSFFGLARPMSLIRKYFDCLIKIYFYNCVCSMYCWCSYKLEPSLLFSNNAGLNVNLCCFYIGIWDDISFLSPCLFVHYNYYCCLVCLTAKNHFLYNIEWIFIFIIAI